MLDHFLSQARFCYYVSMFEGGRSMTVQPPIKTLITLIDGHFGSRPTPMTVNQIWIHQLTHNRLKNK